jgi:hypothetical protein
MSEAEKRVRILMRSNEVINLIENRELESHPLRNSPFVHKDVGYYLANIFEHYSREAIKKDSGILTIEDFFNELGFNCPKLFRSNSPDKLIAMVPAGNVHRLEKIKDMINKQEDIIIKIGEFH